MHVCSEVISWNLTEIRPRTNTASRHKKALKLWHHPKQLCNCRAMTFNRRTERRQCTAGKTAWGEFDPEWPQSEEAATTGHVTGRHEHILHTSVCQLDNILSFKYHTRGYFWIVQEKGVNYCKKSHIENRNKKRNKKKIFNIRLNLTYDIFYMRLWAFI